MIAGKGLSGGIVPLSAVICKSNIVETIKNRTGTFIHGFTFGNNPFTTGVGRIVFRYLKKNNLVVQSAKRGKHLLSKLQTLTKHDIVGDVRGIGLMTAIEFVKNKKTKKPFHRKSEIAEKILQVAMKRGLILYFCVGFVDGVKGDAVMVAPPFIVTEDEIDKIISIFSETISEVQNSL
jgi:adenosylmethionine-8-amino-7-oxononanoate aminotransferase